MGWAGRELSQVELGDVRLDLRLMQIVDRLADHAEQSVPEMCRHWAETKAAYRFWSNERVDWRQILAPHRERTAQRAQAEPVVLVIQDQTLIDLPYPRTATGRLAGERGARVVDGLDVLVAQGAVAFELWTGIPAPRDVMRAAVRSA